MGDVNMTKLTTVELIEAGAGDAVSPFLWLTTHSKKADVELALRAIAPDATKLNVCVQSLAGAKKARKAADACSSVIKVLHGTRRHGPGLELLDSHSLAVLILMAARREVVLAAFEAWAALPAWQRRVPRPVQDMLAQRCELSNKTSAVAAAGILMQVGDTDSLQRTGSRRLGAALYDAGVEETDSSHLVETLSGAVGAAYKASDEPYAYPMADMSTEPSANSYRYMGHLNGSAGDDEVLSAVTETTLRQLTCDDARGDAETLNLILEDLPGSWVNVLRVVQFGRRCDRLYQKEYGANSLRIDTGLRCGAADNALRVLWGAVKPAVCDPYIGERLSKKYGAIGRLVDIIHDLMVMAKPSDPTIHEVVFEMPEWLASNPSITEPGHFSNGPVGVDMRSMLSDDTIVNEPDESVILEVLGNHMDRMRLGPYEGIDAVHLAYDAELRKDILRRFGRDVGTMESALLCIGLDLSSDEILDWLPARSLISFVGIVDRPYHNTDRLYGHGGPAWQNAGRLVPSRTNFSHIRRGTANMVIQAVTDCCAPAEFQSVLNLLSSFDGDGMSLREYLNTYKSLLA